MGDTAVSAPHLDALDRPPRFRWPLHHNRIRRGLKSHTFGPDVRRDAEGRPRAHQGWDFAAPIGTPCYAIGDGVVTLVEERGDYGLRVTLQLDEQHTGRSLWAFYAHLSEAKVATGQRVRLGDVIALTGESGNARGMPVADQHLHFELRTEPTPGLGLRGRIDPLEIYGSCPLGAAIEDVRP